MVPQLPETFTIVGVSKHKGKFKVRYTNDERRAAHLESVGHTEVSMLQLPFASNKTDCVDALLNLDLGEEANLAVQEEARKRGFLDVRPRTLA